MTTIAFRDGVLAADQQMTDGWTRCGATRKIYRVGPYIVGCAGSLQLMTAFVEFLQEWAATNRGLPSISKDLKADDDHSFSAIVVDGDGRTWMYETCGKPYEFTAPYTAFGSGGNIALGAMYMGASAEEAVKAAIAWDAGSGGDVVTLLVSDLPKPTSNVVPMKRKKKDPA